MSRENVGDALDFIADVFEPIMNIASNAKVKEAARKDRKTIAKALVQETRDDAIDVILAFDKADGVDIEYTGVSLFIRILEIISKYGEDLKVFFPFLGQQTAGESSGSPTENTEEEGK